MILKLICLKIVSELKTVCLHLEGYYYSINKDSMLEAGAYGKVLSQKIPGSFSGRAFRPSRLEFSHKYRLESWKDPDGEYSPRLPKSNMQPIGLNPTTPIQPK